MDENYTPSTPASGMSAADCQELAQRRLEEKNAMKARIASLEQSDEEKDDRIAALEAKLSSAGAKPGSGDDDNGDDDDSSNGRKPGAAAVKPKAASSQPPAPARNKRFL